MKGGFFFLLLMIVLVPACGPEASNSNEQSEEEMVTAEAEEQKKGKIIFFGDSLTAAYGLDPGEGFPAIIQSKIEDAGLNYTVVNAGLSGETSAGGNERVDWVLQQSVDIFVLELGANDGLRGIAPVVTYNNLQAIIDKVRAKAPEARIVMVGMEAPPNMGEEYTGAFRSVFKRLAEANDLPLVPFLLKDVGGIPELNQPDGIHPNREGQKIVADNVWEILQPLLQDVG